MLLCTLLLHHHLPLRLPPFPPLRPRSGRSATVYERWEEHKSLFCSPVWDPPVFPCVVRSASMQETSRTWMERIGEGGKEKKKTGESIFPFSACSATLRTWPNAVSNATNSARANDEDDRISAPVSQSVSQSGGDSASTGMFVSASAVLCAIPR